MGVVLIVVLIALLGWLAAMPGVRSFLILLVAIAAGMVGLTLGSIIAPEALAWAWAAFGLVAGGKALLLRRRGPSP